MVAVASTGTEVHAAPAEILEAMGGLSGAPSAVPAAYKDDPVHLAFAGDLSLSIRVGRAIEARARGERVPAEVDAAYPFSAVKDRIAAADIAVGNLECIASKIGAPSSPFPTLHAPVEAIPLVRDAGFDLVSLANNHAGDYGPEALADMMARLDQAGLPHLGQGSPAVHPEEPLIREVKGVRVGFLAFCDVETEKAYVDVRRARARVDFLVIFNHWGREGVVLPIAAQRSFGHGLVQAGADLIVGTHAHVLQPEEWYQGKLIFYGLGNFVFSGMGFDERHRTGGFLEVDVGRSGLLARRLYRVRLDDGGAPHWLDPGPVEPARYP